MWKSTSELGYNNVASTAWDARKLISTQAIADKNLLSKGGSSDPRCTFQLTGVDEPWKSHTIKKCLDPKWKEQFVRLLDVPGDGTSPSLTVTCEDVDGLCGNQKNYGAFVLNRRVDPHAIDAMPARWRGDAGSSPLDRARMAALSPRNDLVKNCRVHPTH